jgi:hypothetical protein
MKVFGCADVIAPVDAEAFGRRVGELLTRVAFGKRAGVLLTRVVTGEQHVPWFLKIDRVCVRVLTPTEPDPTAGRQRRIMLTLVFLVALVIAGFVVGLVWWPELMPWSVQLR